MTDELIDGRYRIEAELGRGGMGIVYRAFDTSLARPVALKCLLQHLRHSQTASLLFREEFRRMSELRHPNFPEVYDTGRVDGVPYFAMELVQGTPINRLGPLELRRVYEIVAQLLQALAFLHARGYVHRDLKPSNIHLLVDGALKVLDLGLMTPVGSLADSTIRGTPGYISPELLRGGLIQEAADLYAVGVLSFELLAGKRPYEGELSEVVRGHLRAPLPSLAERCPEAPAGLCRFVERLLAKDPALRYRDVAEAGRDLSELMGRPVTLESAAQRKGYLNTGHLVGREREWAALQHAVQDIPERRFQNVYLAAAAGVGKSRLLREARFEAQLAGVRVFTASGAEGSRKPFGALSEIVRQATTRFGASALPASLAPLAALVPELAPRLPVETRAQASAEARAGALVELFRQSAADRPLLLIVDDLHWVDHPSLDLLNRALRALAQDRVLLFGAFRDDEVDATHPLFHSVEEGLTRLLPLEPFSRDQVTELLAAMLPNTAIASTFVEGLYRATAGNAFFIDEFLRDLIDRDVISRDAGTFSVPAELDGATVPAGLEATLLRRIERLSKTAQQLARAASIIGERFDLALWQAVSALDDETMLRAAEELQARQLVQRTHTDDYVFVHERAREVLYAHLDSATRRSLHLRAGEALEAIALAPRGDPAPAPQRALGTLAPRLAEHFAGALDVERGVRYALEAAEAALASGAEFDAFNQFKRAASLLEAGSGAASEAQASALLDIYERAAQLPSAVWADAPTCLEWLRRAVSTRRAQGAHEKVFGLSLSHLVTATIAGRYREAHAVLDELLARGVPRESEQWALLYGAGVCLLNWYEGAHEECLQNAVEAIAIFERTLTQEHAKAAFHPFAWALFWREKARSYLGQPVDEQNIALIRQMSQDGRADPVILWHTMTAVGARAGHTGRLADLLAWRTWAEESSRQLGKIYWFECWISHSYVYGMLGAFHLGPVARHVQQLFSSPDPYQRRLGHLFQGRLALARAEYGAAAQSLEEFLAQEEREGPDNSYAEGLIYLAWCHVAQQRLYEAEQVARKGLGVATQGARKNPLHELQFRRVMADIALARADTAKAIAQLERALALAEGGDNPVQRGWVEVGFARAAQLAGRRKEAQAHLQQAETFFDPIANEGALRTVGALRSRWEAPARRTRARVEQQEPSEVPTEQLCRDTLTISIVAPERLDVATEGGYQDVATALGPEPAADS